MRMPGFTAEASLYKTSESYQLTAVHGSGSPVGGRPAVLPQQDVTCVLCDTDRCIAIANDCLASGGACGQCAGVANDQGCNCRVI